jgi:glutathione transport system permease protein
MFSRFIGTAPVANGRTSEPAHSPILEFYKRFRRQRAAIVASVIVLILVLAAIFAPFIAPYDPAMTNYEDVLARPSLLHLAGTDEFGRDIFSRIIWGARISLEVGFSAVAAGCLGGVVLGLLAGYLGGWIDGLIMRICDVLFAFPGILLAIAIVAILGPGLGNVIIAVSVFSVPTFARLVRGSTLALKQMTYVEAALSIGVSTPAIMFRHILPGTIANVLVYLTMRIGTSIITAASLSFIGLGAPVEMPEWGAMLARARDYLAVAPHYVFAPTLAIFVMVLSFNVLGDGLRDAVDPKLDRR